jgi:hypothetical protein
MDIEDVMVVVVVFATNMNILRVTRVRQLR